MKQEVTNLKEVLNFQVNKGVKRDKYRIAKEYCAPIDGWKFYIQRQDKKDGFIVYEYVTDEYWVSLDHLLASDKFQNLFK